MPAGHPLPSGSQENVHTSNMSTQQIIFRNIHVFLSVKTMNKKPGPGLKELEVGVYGIAWQEERGGEKGIII